MGFQEQDVVSWDIVIKSQNDKAEGRSEAPQEDSHEGLPERDSSEVSGNEALVGKGRH